MDAAATAPDLPLSLLERFGGQGPRYTSYPTADRFADGVGEAALRRHLRARSLRPAPLSLYFHLPYCESPCFYCGCHRIISRDRALGTRYTDRLLEEMAARLALCGRESPVAQLHLGGGTPNFLLDEDVARLLAGVRALLPVQDDAELSLEIDPRTLRPGSMASYADLGFNRVSLGVQDFDPAVQEAIYRIQPAEMTLSAMEQARAAGFGSVNVDLVLGLPRQTPESFARTLAQVAAARPDRLAIYTYAHLPARFKAQRHICESELPPAAVRLELLHLTLQTLGSHGYVHIGMDHFARPGDSLAVALREGRLHRNFQGYTTCPAEDLLGFGVSSISEIGSLYSQNTKSVSQYEACLARGELPAVRGIELNADDLLRRRLIRQLMCEFVVPYAPLEPHLGMAFRTYFREEFGELAVLEAAGLVRVEEHAFAVTDLGRFFVRRVAMVFDRYLREARQARAAQAAAGTAAAFSAVV